MLSASMPACRPHDLRRRGASAGGVSGQGPQKPSPQVNDRPVETESVFGRHAATELSVAYAILAPQRRARIARPGQEGRPQHEQRAIYARVSSARQKKDETIGSQTAALREHAAQNRLEVPEHWVFEDEGHSGATLVRPALERLRDLAAQGCVDVVLVYSPDRLARKFAYQALLLEESAGRGPGGVRQGPARDSPEDQLLIQFQACSPSTRRPSWPSGTGEEGLPGAHRVGERAVRRPVRLPVRPQDRPRRGRLRDHRG